MSFSSPFFIFLFLPAALAVYWLLPARLRGIFALLASLLFYAFSDYAHLPVLLLAMAANYVFALLLARSRAGETAAIPAHGKRGSRSLLLFLAICFNLGLLVFCKYGPSLVSSIPFHPLQALARRLHLPLGVSFFTFALLSYLLDVHRGQTAAERSPSRFALYVTLFPKMVAGPIARYRDLSAQLGMPSVERERIAAGVQRFILGLGKKILIANTLAPVVDELFSLPHAALTPPLAWLGAVCYALQIYFDFSGYSDMAIGLGKMLGFEICENFNYPYVSRSIRDFWQRWHISLSSWFRDYLFLPLAYRISRRLPQDRVLGARAEMWAYAVAMLTTMVLCGLWHGAQWTFALWGLWHGLFLVLENARWGKRARRRMGGPLRHLLTQLVILAGWVIFRSESVSQSGRFLGAMAGFGGDGRGILERVPVSDYLRADLVVALLAGCLLAFPVARQVGRWKESWLALLPSYRRRLAARSLDVGQLAALLILLLLCALSLAGGTYNPFVYQQF